VTLLRVFTAILVIGLMALTVVDVGMRYGFNAPMKGSFEITELTVAVMMYAGFPLVSLRNQHVSIDLFDRLFTPRVKRLVDGAAQLLCAAIFMGVALLLWRKTGRMTMSGDLTVSLQISVLPFVYVMAFFSAATALIHLCRLVALATGAAPAATPETQAPTL
jgi:TRAP-type C4-dicarboxylate transport system permease small subunit